MPVLGSTSPLAFARAAGGGLLHRRHQHPPPSPLLLLRTPGRLQLRRRVGAWIGCQTSEGWAEGTLPGIPLQSERGYRKTHSNTKRSSEVFFGKIAAPLPYASKQVCWYVFTPSPFQTEPPGCSPTAAR